MGLKTPTHQHTRVGEFVFLAEKETDPVKCKLIDNWCDMTPTFRYGASKNHFLVFLVASFGRRSRRVLRVFDFDLD